MSEEAHLYASKLHDCELPIKHKVHYSKRAAPKPYPEVLWHSAQKAIPGHPGELQYHADKHTNRPLLRLISKQVTATDAAD